MNKLEKIKDLIKENQLSADFKISIFISAAISFKRDSLLSPFPKSYLIEGIKDFEKLVRFNLDFIQALSLSNSHQWSISKFFPISIKYFFNSRPI